MIQQEEINLKQFKTGVTFYIFSDKIYNEALESPSEYLGPFPSYVLYNQQNVVNSINYYSGDSIWSRNSKNNFVPLSSITNNYLTGYTIVKTVDANLTDAEINNTINKTLTRLSNPNRPGNPASASAATNYMFYERKLIEDFYVDLKIQRSYNSLDTLKVYNNLVDSYPTQESTTGVVFGRLTAIQKLKNEEGQNIRIPLANVPIGIFNPSNSFPEIFSVDDNGDRISLNIKEAANKQDYFNDYSYFTDYDNYLRSADSFSAVPAQYKYVTKTNENGEFILYDIPVGQQIAMFEVDLFKQGLTKDEIALNFFPFPNTDDANIDSTPSFAYKQFPIDVVPSWGLSQTGYTNLDIHINLDLRKWATFYISPMAYNGYKLGSNELSNVQPYINVDIRDMSRVGFPRTNISLVEIEDILNKDKSQSLLWENEFAQIGSTARFYNHGFKAFKVRANMYDPNGYKTNSDGVPMINSYSKGVWLAGYQFKYYYNKPDEIFRTTGFQRNWEITGQVGRDHFNLNKYIVSPTKNSETNPDFLPPYDRPWNHNYPTPYKIPRKPTQLNFDRFYSNGISAGRFKTGQYFALEQPLYKDGDLIGFMINQTTTGIKKEVGGYGAQFDYSDTTTYNGHYRSNRFSQEVTSLYIYKYEAGVTWNEKYSNTYEPSNSSFGLQPGISKVVNGEQFQRVECGYGYWLRPDGLPPICYKDLGDVIFPISMKVGVSLSSGNYGPGSLKAGDRDTDIIKATSNKYYIDIYKVDNKDICIALDNHATFSEGGLDIYRIIDPNSLVPPGMNIVPTFAEFHFQQFYYQRDPNGTDRLQTAYNDNEDSRRDMMFARVGSNSRASQNYQSLSIRIINNGEIQAEISPGNILYPGQGLVYSANQLGLNNGIIKLPGNKNLDYTEGKYVTAAYSMQFQNVTFDGESVNYTHDINIGLGTNEVLATENSTPYYLLSYASGMRTQYNDSSDSCDTDTSSDWIGGSQSKYEHSVIMDGAFFDFSRSYRGGPGGIDFLLFNTRSIIPRCGSLNFDKGTVSIPIELQ